MLLAHRADTIPEDVTKVAAFDNASRNGDVVVKGIHLIPGPP
jgi:hypothetical protein